MPSTVDFVASPAIADDPRAEVGKHLNGDLCLIVNGDLCLIRCWNASSFGDAMTAPPLLEHLVISPVVAWGAVALVAVALLTGAKDPEIIGVKVPAQEVSKIFPAGTELRVMPADKFASLVAGARAASVRHRAAEPPRLIRVRHYARFRSGCAYGPLRARRSSRAIGPG